MKVSVIVPVYNTEEYLDACLDSLVKQTLDDIEILVVNDGSPDNSQQIIDKYVKEYPDRVKGLIKENGGQATARNMGLNLAKGEYIGFVDSDDWVDTDMYERMYNKAHEENAEIVVCDTTDHYKTNTVYHKPSEFTNKLRQTPSPCNKIFKYKLIGDLRYPHKKMWYEDFTFITELLMKANNISRIHKDFYHCNCRDESTMSNNNSLKNLDIIEAFELIVEFAKENEYYEQYKNDLEYMLFDHIGITTINRVAAQKSKEKKQVLKTLREYVNSNISKDALTRIYGEVSKSRRIIAKLNLAGHWKISNFILNLNAKLKK